MAYLCVCVLEVTIKMLKLCCSVFVYIISVTVGLTAVWVLCFFYIYFLTLFCIIHFGLMLDVGDSLVYK